MPSETTPSGNAAKSIVPYLPEYIKNPIMTTLLGGNWSLPLCKMMESIIMQLQDRINDHIKSGEMNELMTLQDTVAVTKDNPEDTGMLKFEIPLKTLGIPSQNYKELDDACEAIMNMKSTVLKADGSKEIMNVFHKVRVPAAESTVSGSNVQYKSGQRRLGVVEIKMHIEAAKEILSLRKGYVEHIFGVPQLCRSPRTHRLYVYLSAWLDKGGRDYPYNDLKEWLGAVTFDANHKHILHDAYPKYSEFSRAVLRPAQIEMKRLSDEGKVDFWFDYEPVYPTGKTRGIPYAVRFITHISEYGRLNAQGRLLRSIHSRLITQYGITQEEWESVEPLLSRFTQERINKGMNHLVAQMKKIPTGKTHAYATKVLIEWAKQQEADYVQFEESDAKQQETLRWKKLETEACKTMKDWWNIYGVCCHSIGVEEGTLKIEVPSTFVAEQWNEHADFWNEQIKAIWGVSKYLYKLPD